MIRAHKAIPEVVNGYELDRLQFSVIVPIERTNLITNPSFETNTTGYTSVDGATLTRTTTTQRRGVYSLQIKPGLSSVSGVYYTSSALTAGQTYAFSLDVFIRGGKKFQIRAFDGIRTLVTRPIIGKNYWERVSFIFTAVTTGAHRFYFEKNGESNNTFTDNVFTDGWQLELCEAGNYFETTYIDGDQLGLVPNQAPAAYYWNGAPNASTSVRTNQTRAGGQVVKLSDLGFSLMSVVGLGMAAIANITLPLGLVGSAVFQRDVPQQRQFTLVGSLAGNTFEEFERNKQSIVDLIRFDSVAINQPLVLQYQYFDDNGEARGELQQIACSYRGGLEGRNDSYYQERISIQFNAAQPYIYSDGNKASNLLFASNVNPANGLLWRDTNGVWSSMGSGVSTTPGLIEQIIIGQDGLVYVAGQFASAGGVADTARIASYNINTGEWKPLGFGANAAVVSMVLGPDGSIYAGGDFTLMSGVANTVRIAKWNPAARTWSALSTGANGSVRGMTFGIDGKLYVTGDFTTIGGVAANRFAVWDGNVWAAIGTGLTGGASPSGKIVISGPDGNLYIGGIFTTANGVASASIAKYNPITNTWSTLGTGTTSTIYALAFGLDGTLYAGGDFTTIGGVTALAAAAWNGVSWKQVGSGFSNPPASLTAQINVIAVDAQGLIYFGGFFQSSGSISYSLFAKSAIWNGSSVAFIDVIPPTAITLNEIVFDKSGRMYIGYFKTGSAQAAAVNTINNSGSAQAYPTFIFNGPGTIVQITNQTTNKYIYFNLTLVTDEIATLILSPTRISFTSNLRGNLIGAILPGSNLSDFYLKSGDNSISVLIANATAPTLASIMWRESQWCFDFDVRR